MRQSGTYILPRLPRLLHLPCAAVPRPIFLTLNGSVNPYICLCASAVSHRLSCCCSTSMYDESGKIGGDSGLSLDGEVCWLALCNNKIHQPPRGWRPLPCDRPMRNLARVSSLARRNTPRRSLRSCSRTWCRHPRLPRPRPRLLPR